MARFNTADVRHYYDRHTDAFINYGRGGRVGAIHRAIRGPGTRTEAEAFHYVDDLIVELARTLLSPNARSQSAPTTSETLHLVDLGCGVCGSLCYIAERLPIRGTGVTVSPVQARLAAERIHSAGLADRVRCIEGDFCDLPASVPPADLIFAIESFVHAPAPERFFAEGARLLRRGGLLAICDDFIKPVPAPAGRSRSAARAIDRFARGWHVNTLVDRSELQALAANAGFEHVSTTDLSASIDIRRARDRAIDVLVTVLEWLPWRISRLDYLAGGSALQRCLANGWIEYDLTVFRRS